MITAKGNKYGKSIEVVYNNDKFLFNGQANRFYEDDIRYEMKMRHPIGGTYYTEAEDDILNVAEVLRGWFFDEPNVDVTIQDEDIHEIPYEGYIY